MLKSKERTKGRKYPRGDYWKAQCAKAYERAGKTCEVSGVDLKPLKNPGDPVEKWKYHWRRACHHVFAERYIRRFLKFSDPHILENLLIVAPKIHSMITGVEWRLFSGDYIGYMAELRRIGVDQPIIDRALKALNQSARERSVKTHTETTHQESCGKDRQGSPDR